MEYRLIRADESKLRKLLSMFVVPTMWMTYRLPFQRYVRITYPIFIADPETSLTLQHELCHVPIFSTWWGPWVVPLLVSLIPLPVLFSGRWFVERWAYLADIKAGRITIDQAVDNLWNLYAYAWPKSLMYRWFNRHIK